MNERLELKVPGIGLMEQAGLGSPRDQAVGLMARFYRLWSWHNGDGFCAGLDGWGRCIRPYDRRNKALERRCSALI